MLGTVQWILFGFVLLCYSQGYNRDTLEHDWV